jgi:hypothetical protein
MCKLCQAQPLRETQYTKLFVNAAGVITISAKEHKRFTELSRDAQLELYTHAGKLSVLLYEHTGAHGTNLVGHDTEHAHYTLIRRMENDGITLTPEGKRGTPGELQGIGQKIADEAWIIGRKEEKRKEPVAAPPVEKITPKTTAEKDYRIRNLTRRR